MKKVVYLMVIALVLSFVAVNYSYGDAPVIYCTIYTCTDGSFSICTDYPPQGENIQCREEYGAIYCTAYIDGPFVLPIPPTVIPFISPLPIPTMPFLSPLSTDVVPEVQEVISEPVIETLCDELWMGTCLMWTDGTRITRIDCPE